MEIASSTTKSLKLCSLNLAGLRNWGDRLEGIAKWVDMSQPDILLLQEVCINEANVNQAVQLNKALKHSYPYLHDAIARYYQPKNPDLPSAREGLALLSRFPAISTHVIPLTKRPDDRHYRLVQLAQLSAGESTINIANVHFSNNKYSGEQLEEFMGNLGSFDGGWMIGGDFNIFDLREYAHLYKDSYVSTADLHDYVSFPSEGFRFDYFLVSKTYNLEYLNVIDGMSDHSALEIGVKRVGL